MPESPEHKQIKKTLRDFFSSQYGVAINEYYDTGFIIDVFSVTFSSIEIMVETIWTKTKTNFYRDLTIILSSDAKIKIVIVNPEILDDPGIVRYFERIKISETKKGYSIIGMVGWNFNDTGSILKELKVEIDKIVKVRSKISIEKIDQIKEQLFDNEISLASIISRCIGLSKDIDILNYYEWLQCELYGYYGYIQDKVTQKIEDFPGSPHYRGVKGKVIFSFNRVGELFEQEVSIIITQPIHEIESWINRMSPSGEMIINLPLQKSFLDSIRKHGPIDPTQKMPVILTRYKLERITTSLKLELHKFLDELSDKIFNQ